MRLIELLRQKELEAIINGRTGVAENYRMLIVHFLWRNKNERGEEQC